MDNLQLLRSTAVPLPLENIDTDQIIPVRYRKSSNREGMGAKLFADWRYAATGELKHGFVLNDARYHGQILLAGQNFGVGSNPEHAAWALYDFGFRVVISNSFADTFRSTAWNTGLLPLQVSAEALHRLVARVTHYPSTPLVVDLLAQTLAVPVWAERIAFDLNPRQKEGLPNSHSNIDSLLPQQAATTTYEEAPTWSI
jgi:3-isopropylmalate/(R)-2-methylmalate dehydratase small subunit